MNDDFQQRPGSLGDLLTRQRDRVQEVLNVLIESPYFYQQDNDDAFRFLRRYHHEFARFFADHFGWELIVDAKCARVYKPHWYNREITPGSREMFNFTRRDECIAFMLLLEFFEHKLEVESITVDDHENLRFHFGELLHYTVQRFHELYPQNTEDYTEETVRAKIIRPIMPQLEKYRFLKKIPPPRDEQIGEADTIYEALPALYHYNVSRLSRNVDEASCLVQQENPTSANPLHAQNRSTPNTPPNEAGAKPFWSLRQSTLVYDNEDSDEK